MSEQPTQNAQQQGIQRTVTRSLLLVVGMCAFVAAMVPLYDLFCEITGLNGKTGDEAYVYDPATVTPDRSRLVKVNFITNTHGTMSWQFWPGKGGVRVHPGELKEVSFYVKNTTDKVMVGVRRPFSQEGHGRRWSVHSGRLRLLVIRRLQ